MDEDEFLLYLYEQENIFEDIGGIDIWDTNFDGIPARDVAKNNAVNSIIVLKTSVYQAKNLNIALNNNDVKKYKKESAHNK